MLICWCYEYHLTATLAAHDRCSLLCHLEMNFIMFCLARSWNYHKLAASDRILLKFCSSRNWHFFYAVLWTITVWSPQPLVIQITYRYIVKERGKVFLICLQDTKLWVMYLFVAKYCKVYDCITWRCWNKVKGFSNVIFQTPKLHDM